MKQYKKKSGWLLKKYSKVMTSYPLIVWVQLSNDGMMKGLKGELQLNSLECMMVKLNYLSKLKDCVVYKVITGGCSVFLYAKKITKELLDYLITLEKRSDIVFVWWQVGKVNLIESSEVLYYYSNSQRFSCIVDRISYIWFFFWKFLFFYKTIFYVLFRSFLLIK